jgi:hypothetical protein
MLKIVDSNYMLIPVKIVKEFNVVALIFKK